MKFNLNLLSYIKLSANSLIVNFDNIPGRMMSGLDDNMLDSVTKERGNRYLKELDPV